MKLRIAFEPARWSAVAMMTVLVMAVIVMVFAKTRPTSAQGTRRVECISAKSLQQVQEWMNQEIAAGKTEFLQTGVALCGW